MRWALGGAREQTAWAAPLSKDLSYGVQGQESSHGGAESTLLKALFLLCFQICDSCPCNMRQCRKRSMICMLIHILSAAAVTAKGLQLTYVVLSVTSGNHSNKSFILTRLRSRLVAAQVSGDRHCQKGSMIRMFIQVMSAAAVTATRLRSRPVAAQAQILNQKLFQSTRSTTTLNPDGLP